MISKEIPLTLTIRNIYIYRIVRREPVNLQHLLSVSIWYKNYLSLSRSLQSRSISRYRLGRLANWVKCTVIDSLALSKSLSSRLLPSSCTVMQRISRQLVNKGFNYFRKFKKNDFDRLLAATGRNHFITKIDWNSAVFLVMLISW